LVHHEPLLKRIKVYDKIMFLTKNEFHLLCKNRQLLTPPMRNMLKLDGFDMKEINELLKMALRYNFNITILSLGQESQGIGPEFLKTLNLIPCLEYLNLSLLEIHSIFWDLSGFPLKGLNLYGVTCQQGFGIRMPSCLRTLNVYYQDEMTIAYRSDSEIRLLMDNCNNLKEW
jgi:hypothetical protein